MSLYGIISMSKLVCALRQLIRHYIAAMNKRDAITVVLLILLYCVQSMYCIVQACAKAPDMVIHKRYRLQLQYHVSYYDYVFKIAISPYC